MRQTLIIIMLPLLYLVACAPAETAIPSTDPTAAPTVTSDPASPEPTARATDSVPTVEIETTNENEHDETAREAPNRPQILRGDTRPSRLRALTSDWNTNWTLRTIEYDEILSGGPPRDGIPSIDDPQFTTAVSASEWLADNEPVIALEINGDARAYPLQILTWHEIVNDTVGGEPVVVTFCPLCNSALVFDRRVGDQTFAFGTSGLLRNSDLIMYDRTTETLWQQFTGQGIVGDLAGEQLTFLPAAIVSFADFQEMHPEGQILSRETGHNRNYGTNPYAGYDTIGQNPFLFDAEQLDGRLPAMARVVTVGLAEEEGDTAVAYPLSILQEETVINDDINGQPIVVMHQPGTASALGARVIAEADDVGATGVFSRVAGGETLTFAVDNGRVLDEQTGSTWNIFGQATEGELAGTQLERLVSGDHFWFSWAAFRPDTTVYTQE